MDTPVPISNTEVKHFNGEDSVSENSKLPIFFCLLKSLLCKGFFCYIMFRIVVIIVYLKKNILIIIIFL